MAEVMRPTRKEEVEEGAPVWLLTYSDLVTQMLVFFVMLFSFATLDPVKMAMSAKAVNESMGGSPGGGQPRPDDAVQNIIRSVDTTEFEQAAEGGVRYLVIKDGTKVRMDQPIRRFVITLGAKPCA